MIITISCTGCRVWIWSCRWLYGTSISESGLTKPWRHQATPGPELVTQVIPTSPSLVIVVDAAAYPVGNISQGLHTDGIASVCALTVCSGTVQLVLQVIDESAILPKLVEPTGMVRVVVRVVATNLFLVQCLQVALHITSVAERLGIKSRQQDCLSAAEVPRPFYFNGACRALLSDWLYAALRPEGVAEQGVRCGLAVEATVGVVEDI